MIIIIVKKLNINVEKNSNKDYCRIYDYEDFNA